MAPPAGTARQACAGHRDQQPVSAFGKQLQLGPAATNPVKLGAAPLQHAAQTLASSRQNDNHQLYRHRHLARLERFGDRTHPNPATTSGASMVEDQANMWCCQNKEGR